jgi:hypothetical protein
MNKEREREREKKTSKARKNGAYALVGIWNGLSNELPQLQLQLKQNSSRCAISLHTHWCSQSQSTNGKAPFFFFKVQMQRAEGLARFAICKCIFSCVHLLYIL